MWYDCGVYMYASMYVVMYLCLRVRMDGWLYGWMDVCIYV